MYHEVNVCFHDKPSVVQNYFFAGNSLFYEEWNDFQDQISLRNKSKKNYEFSVIPVRAITSDNPKTNYLMNYDMKIFDSYDGKPIKVFKEQQNPLCEVFIGDFFMSR